MISLQSTGHLYIHIPFCSSRCHYCAFPSIAIDEVPEKAYLTALEVEFKSRLRSWPQASLPLSTLYLGGGTPSLLSSSFYSRIIDLLAQELGFCDDPEITLEANPADITLEKISAYKAAGINRISLGAQTFAPEGLQLLGRRHDHLTVEKAVNLLRQGGIGNLSLDLIYAWPGQSLSGLAEDLRKLVVLAPEHVSAYSLSLEPGTSLAQAVAAGEMQALNEEMQAEMMGLVAEFLGDSGLYRYEVSNFARNHHLQAQHNLAYWHLHDFLGLGAGACGGWRCRKEEGHWAERYSNISDPFTYMQRLAEKSCSLSLQGHNAETAPDPWFEKEIIDRKTSLTEALMMGLRLRQGVDLDHLRTEYGLALLDAVISKAQKLRADGLLDWDKKNLWITDRGLFLSDTIISFLL